MNFLPPKDQFLYKEGVIAGDPVWLTTPSEMGVKWTPELARFRSAIVLQSDGKIISSGFRKFTNLGEQPDFEPWGENKLFEAIEKKDGSLLIISKYKGQLITRTRGTFDARVLDNGVEVDELIQKYPKVFDNPFVNSGEYSVLMEWTTPNNVIVIRESENPTLWFLGIVTHESGRYASQAFLDDLGKEWDVPRPARYVYSSLSECVDDVKLWEKKEGVVIYSLNGQTLKKIKAEQYLRLHRAKSAISSIKNLVELYLSTDRSANYEEFYRFVETTLDHELAEIAKDDLFHVASAHACVLEEQKRVIALLAKWENFSRKDQAKEICSRWQDWRKSFAFSVLDGKAISDETLAKILLYELQPCND